jgi:hypothetical protein
MKFLRLDLNLDNVNPAKEALINSSSEKLEEPNFDATAKTVVDGVDKPCSDYFDSGYRCVPYFQCQNGEVLVDGAGFYLVRFIVRPF